MRKGGSSIRSDEIYDSIEDNRKTKGAVKKYKIYKEQMLESTHRLKKCMKENKELKKELKKLEKENKKLIKDNNDLNDYLEKL